MAKDTQEKKQPKKPDTSKLDSLILEFEKENETLKKSIYATLAFIDPTGIGAPEPGSPGYMVEVVKNLRQICPVIKD